MADNWFDAGKTEVYSTQIESLQTDLQPWAAQIADQQASIDLATNERDLLAEKTNSIKVGIDEAKSTLENLAADDAAKVSSVWCEREEGTMLMRRVA